MCTPLILYLQNAIPIRGDPHILIVGDPGLGKSQVRSPIARYVYTYRYMYVCMYVSNVHTHRISLINIASLFTTPVQYY